MAEYHKVIGIDLGTTYSVVAAYSYAKSDVKVIPNMWFSIELQATSPVPEWGGQAVRSAQEEDVMLAADGVPRWALKRQTAYHLVR